jgi:hypothetical protein
MSQSATSELSHAHTDVVCFFLNPPVYSQMLSWCCGCGCLRTKQRSKKKESVTSKTPTRARAHSARSLSSVSITTSPPPSPCAIRVRRKKTTFISPHYNTQFMELIEQFKKSRSTRHTARHRDDLITTPKPQSAPIMIDTSEASNPVVVMDLIQPYPTLAFASNLNNTTTASGATPPGSAPHALFLVHGTTAVKDTHTAVTGVLPTRFVIPRESHLVHRGGPSHGVSFRHPLSPRPEASTPAAAAPPALVPRPEASTPAVAPPALVPRPEASTPAVAPPALLPVSEATTPAAAPPPLPHLPVHEDFLVISPPRRNTRLSRAVESEDDEQYSSETERYVHELELVMIPLPGLH